MLSTTTALAQVCDTAQEASDKKEIAAAIAIDESAAFDSLSKEILLDKLRMYKMHEDTIGWIRDYLEAQNPICHNRCKRLRDESCYNRCATRFKFRTYIIQHIHKQLPRHSKQS